MQLLELNDLGIAWYSQQGQRISEPGAALVENNTALYGEGALSRARLAPRGFQDQHWQLLNSDSLAVTAPGVQNNADLIYRHLQALAARTQQEAGRSENTLICAVPGSVTNNQLGLLLGIAAEAGITIGSFVSAPLLHCLNISLPSEAFCIDIQNRRGILTRLVRDSQNLSHADAQELPALGMNGLIDGWLDQLTDQFVAKSRFDPLRVAETEQQLFDQVRAWLPLGGTLSAAVDHEEHQRAVDLGFQEAAGRAQQRYREAQKKLPAQATVVLTPDAAQLPGFADYLGGHGHTVIAAGKNDLWDNAQRCAELDNPQAVHFIKSLATKVAAVETAADAQHATHALQNHVATPLAAIAQKLANIAGADDVGYRVSAESSGVFINETQTTTDSPLAPGDRLQINDQSFTCIRIDDGPTA